MQNNTPKIGTIEEITDMIDPRAYKDKNFKKGVLLKFTGASLVVTKVSRKHNRTWARHTQTYGQDVVISHHDHNVDSTPDTLAKYGVPYCTDCEVPVSVSANGLGKKRAQEREDRTLADGTVI
jgi:hypothetical protein